MISARGGRFQSPSLLSFICILKSGPLVRLRRLALRGTDPSQNFAPATGSAASSHPPARTKCMILNGSETITGDIIIIPMDISTEATHHVDDEEGDEDDEADLEGSLQFREVTSAAGNNNKAFGLGSGLAALAILRTKRRSGPAGPFGA